MLFVTRRKSIAPKGRSYKNHKPKNHTALWLTRADNASADSRRSL